jgi:hypothetical protein
MNPKKTIIGTAATAVVGAALLAGCGTAGGLADDLAGSAPQTFSYTGAPVTVTVPAGAIGVTVTATGGSGGVGQGETSNNRAACTAATGAAAGGIGGVVTGTVPVTAGQTLIVSVGGAGSTDKCDGATSSAGGWGGDGGGGGGGNIGGGYGRRRPVRRRGSSRAWLASGRR